MCVCTGYKYHVHLNGLFDFWTSNDGFFSAEYIVPIFIAYYSRFATLFIDLFDTFFMNKERVKDNNSKGNEKRKR